MPAGMTLQQLYSQTPYDGNSPGKRMSPNGNVPSSAAMNVNMPPNPNANAPGNVGPAPGMPGGNMPKPDPRAADNAAAYGLPPNQDAYADHAQMAMAQHYSQQYGQMPPHHPYAADPLPFEYTAMRKYHEGSREQRFQQPGMMAGGMPYNPADNYAQQAPPQTAHYDDHAPKVGEEAPRNPGYPPNYATDRQQYHPPNEMPPQYANAGPQGMPQHMYGPHSMMPGMAQQTQPSYMEAPPLKKPSENVPAQYATQAPTEYAPPAGPQGASQEAVIKVKTPLKPKYWRNGRRNLQCFPSCKVYGDYSAIKIEDLKHHDFMWGKCRGSIITEVTLNSSVAFDDILILGRVHSLENIPVAFEEAVIRECMLGRMVEPEAMDTMKDQWITGERLPDFVQQETNTSCYEFKPKVWKYTEDMTQGKCKRRNVKYYVQFEAFVLVKSGERRYYACIGSGMSTAFEVGSSRVLARQKRKAAASGNEFPMQDMKVAQAAGAPQDMSMQAMHHQMMAAPGMMPAPGMYPPQYASYAPTRGMPAGYPPQPTDPGMTARYYQSAPTTGMKRKMESDVPALKSDRPNKVLKAAVAM